MTYEEALRYIHSTPNFSRSASLKRIRALMAQLGNPQKSLSFVHIAGTNGKGSTAAIAASILQAAGYRTGLYTSPYLQRFNERIRLNGEPISDDALASAAARVRDAVEAVTAAGMESPNEFERVTAIALYWYAKSGADLVVLEVGLGGRYDATNVIDTPEACAITSVSLDHTAILGNTLEAIAREKAGILKPGSVCVLSPEQPEPVRHTILEAAHHAGAEVIEANIRSISDPVYTQNGTSLTWQGLHLRLPLLGQFQLRNLCTSLKLIEVLREQGYAIPQRAVSEGVHAVRWPGRMELFADRFVLLDCCHNPDGISALCQDLDRLFHGVPLTAIMGMMADKDYQSGIRMIAAHSQRFFAVSPPGPRALPVEEIHKEAAETCGEVYTCRYAEDALRLALTTREEGGLIVVCGSIPLVGEVRSLLQEKITDCSR